MSLIFVDCEASPIDEIKGTTISPWNGVLTEFGAVSYINENTFHGVLATSELDPDNPAVRIGAVLLGRENEKDVFTSFDRWLKENSDGQPIFISDNPAFDWQWISYGFDKVLGRNPFGYSARRIGDYYAGVVGDWRAASKWKKLRDTKHTHHPVNDAMGNYEAFKKIEELAKELGK